MTVLNPIIVLKRCQKRMGIIVLLSLVTIDLSLAAEQVPSIVGTGITVQPYDPNWTVTGPLLPTGQAMVVTTRPAEWSSVIGPEQWVAPFANASQEFPAGNYRYRLKFDLAGFDPGSAVIFGDALSDDGGAIFLNGEPMHIPTKLFNETLAPGRFTITEGFVPGENTLEILVVNVLGERDGAVVGTPTGLIARLRGEATSDLVPPEIAYLGLSPEEISTALIDPNDTPEGPLTPNDVVIGMRLSDIGSGVSELHLKLEDPNPDETADEDILLNETFSLERKLRLSRTVRFSPTASEGLWSLSGTIVDGAGNRIDFNGGEGEIPEGVIVTNSACDEATVPWRVGPYETASFGYSSKLFGTTYEFVEEASTIRDLQAQMFQWQGWDDELRGADYAIYLSYCEMKALKKWLNKGTYYQRAYDGERQKIEWVVSDLEDKVAKLKTYINQIQLEINRPEYQDFVQNLRDLDREDIEEYDPDWVLFKGNTDSAFFVSFVNTFVNYLIDGAKVASKVVPPGPLDVAGTLYDLYNIAAIYYEYFYFYFDLGDSAYYEQLGLEFSELFGMLVEMQMLLIEYEKQLPEYERILMRN